MILYPARVAGSDVAHLASYVDEELGQLRAICLEANEPQLFDLVRASEGERLVWCGACESYRAHLAALATIAEAQGVPHQPIGYLHGKRIELP